MSYTTILNIYPGERFEEREELRNGWLTAPIVWDHIWGRYGVKRHEYDTWMLAGDRFWDIQHDERLSSPDRTLFHMTFDRFYIASKDFARAAADIDAFIADGPRNSGHWPHIHDLLLSAPDVPAIGFHWTSVAENPFAGLWNEDAEDYDPIDWSTATDLYAYLDAALVQAADEAGEGRK